MSLRPVVRADAVPSLSVNAHQGSLGRLIDLLGCC
jgi:hypothetical protein